MCDPPCSNGGTCTGPNTCQCPENWEGVYCEQGMCRLLYTPYPLIQDTLYLQPYNAIHHVPMEAIVLDQIFVSVQKIGKEFIANKVCVDSSILHTHLFKIHCIYSRTMQSTMFQWRQLYWTKYLSVSRKLGRSLLRTRYV